MQQINDFITYLNCADETSRDYLNFCIDLFVYINKTDIQQRSIEWTEKRKKKIGGSEISILMGKKGFKTLTQLIGEKSGVLKADFSYENIACSWGVAFESIIEHYVEYDLKTKIKGNNIWLTTEFGHTNSPDGICVVELVDTDYGIKLSTGATRKYSRGSEGLYIALLEFKCPFRRRPRSVVPEKYVPQVWSGLSFVDIASFGLFIDAVFRKCAFEQLLRVGVDEYDIVFHQEFSGTKDWVAPLAWGIIGFIGDIEDEDINDAFGISPENPKAIDFGHCDTSNAMFTKAMSMGIEGKKMYLVRSDPHLRIDPNKVMEWLESEAEKDGKYLIGFLPWKLFEVNYVQVQRKYGFLEEIKPAVVETLDKIERITKSPTPKNTFYELTGYKDFGEIDMV